MRRRGGMVIGVLVGVLALAAAGCGGGSDNGGGSASAATTTTAAAGTTTTAGGGGGGGTEIQLVASNFKFDKTSLDMQSGSQVKVELRNQGQAEHNFTFTEAGANQDVEAGEDATATFTAPAAGSYQFFCKYHPSQMKGTVTVT
ncbi:MAG: cupredoxin domain-containing protein [Actinomycetota bacterium]